MTFDAAAEATAQVREAEAALAAAAVRRDALVREREREGATLRALAAEFGISFGRVHQIVKRAKGRS